MSETTTTKTCPQCGEAKPATKEFFCPDKKGNYCWCRQCVSDRANTWCKNNPERAARNRKNHMLRKRYGITLEEYEMMLAEQGGVCKICKKPPVGVGREGILHVDHDHATGLVRGLLCSLCNKALGAMRDDPALLRAGADYLESHQRT